MLRDPALNRRGFGLKKQIQPELQSEYHSLLVQEIRKQGRMELDGHTIFLAKEFGFCYGVDRAVNLAYETRRQFPDKRIWITTEIIHNPRVNNNLREMGVQFMDGVDEDDARWGEIAPEDVVLLPAFGNSHSLTEKLKETGATIVDTTCGSVMHVWRRVAKYQEDGFTSLIHGKHNHEETIATKSRAGKYIVVLNMKQADKVCDYIEGRGDREAFMAEFGPATSPGFDPDTDLAHIGVANQTTMLSSESLAIAEKVRQAMIRRFGEEQAGERFRAFDTICSATQERQDAMIEMLKEDLDLAVIVGGFNSSNTAHLLEMALDQCPAFHIYDESCLRSLDEIHHCPLNTKQGADLRDWFPQGARRIGFTAGASTPDAITGNCIVRLLDLLGVDI